MFKKIVFLCTDPWERFLSFGIQGHSRKYYEVGKLLMKMKNLEPLCKEYIDIYGEPEIQTPANLFENDRKDPQLVYIQSQRRELLKKIFHEADMVIMGIPGNKKEFEKIYLKILPWKEQILFLWNEQTWIGENDLDGLLQEFCLMKEQIIELKTGYQKIFGINQAPGLLRELMNCF